MGTLFYKDDKGKVCSKTIHSFRSPYSVKKEVEKKASKVLGLFYPGKKIYLSNLDKNNVTATQLGRDARLIFGDYRVVKVNKKDIIIEYIPKQEDDSVCRYQIKSNKMNKIIMTNKLMAGESFQLNEFFVKKGNEALDGRYKVDQERSDYRYFTVVNIQGGEDEFIASKRLVSHLVKKSKGVIQEDDTVVINKDHINYITAVTTDNMPNQQLSDGCYLIKGFKSSGKRVKLTSQNGTVYRINSKVLEYVKQAPG